PLRRRAGRLPDADEDRGGLRVAAGLRRRAPRRPGRRPAETRLRRYNSRMDAKRPPLGIQKIEALHYYVRDLERTRRFFVDKLASGEIGASSPDLEREGRQRSAAFRAGDATFVLHQPIGEGGRAWRYLRKHPEGVGTIVLDVEDIDRAFRLLDERGGTFITDLQRFTDAGGPLARV